ncbi:alpha/beta hydrolase [Streptomyces sp. Z26]|uniref:alpha/beta hydrolase n=1 Tax=Streptomyces sp. Z26 TaxID=2500177 RepID=UPI000EF13040|nr:alpha/beta hydrolase [Streptomyces sp. Z26]RLL70168.1 alpha/beta hydrolase [Streptomyces sp. Z26]
MQRRTFALSAASTAAVVLAGTLAAAPAPAGAATPAAARTASDASAVAAPKWTGCATSAYPRLQCATVRVPLDHARPGGRKITLALSRVPHTARTYQGPLLVNPGGPGGSGLSLAGFVAESLPAEVAAQYDVIGFDPRGVGRSEPRLDCRPGHFDPVRLDSVPRDAQAEQANVQRAGDFARSCAQRHHDVLPHLGTVAAARDMEVIRRALGSPRINYFGYSYGTYLGAVYAKLYPHRVRRAVLDSVVDPKGVWYEANLAQDVAFDARHKAFAAWVAAHDDEYGLGTDPADVEAAWYGMRDAVREEPAAGRVGPSELEDTYLPGGYYNGYWPELAEAFAAYVNDGDERPLGAAYDTHGAVDAAGDNGYSVYTAVQCRDASWPRDWRTWHEDMTATHAKAPFMTWNNAWYNAPCAFWPGTSLTPPDISNRKLPPVLLFQATDDAATPYQGAVNLRRALDRSRLVVEEGGGNHGITLSGNGCLDRRLAAYLATGEVPRRGGATGRVGGADAVCEALPEPEAEADSPAGDSGAEAEAGAKSGARAGGSGAGSDAPGRGDGRTRGAELHRLLGFRA